jgi:hypothetical protein
VPAGLADRVAEALDADSGVVAGVLTEIATRFHDIAVVATREDERRAELAEHSSLVLTVPTLDRDVNDVADLLALAEHLRA